jgi:hypothetical protein
VWVKHHTRCVYRRPDAYIQNWCTYTAFIATKAPKRLIKRTYRPLTGAQCTYSAPPRRGAVAGALPLCPPPAYTRAAESEAIHTTDPPKRRDCALPRAKRAPPGHTLYTQSTSAKHCETSNAERLALAIGNRERRDSALPRAKRASERKRKETSCKSADHLRVVPESFASRSSVVKMRHNA